MIRVRICQKIAAIASITKFIAWIGLLERGILDGVGGGDLFRFFAIRNLPL